MESVLSDFGIQPVLLAAQAVNFLVLLFILQKFLYKPVLKALQVRKDAITKGLKDAEEIEKQLAKTEEDRQNILSKTETEAKKIINEATISANQIINEAHTKAQNDIAQLVLKSEAQMKLEKDKINQEIREELANLVAEGLKVITGKVLTNADKDKLTKDSIKNIS